MIITLGMITLINSFSFTALSKSDETDEEDEEIDNSIGKCRWPSLKLVFLKVKLIMMLIFDHLLKLK